MLKSATRVFLFFSLVFIIAVQNGFGQNLTAGKLKAGTLNEVPGIYSDGVIDGYLLYLPRDFDQSKSYPLIIFLQGGAGVGGTLQQVVSWGLPKLLLDQNVNFKGHHYMRDSFIIACPHMTAGPFRERQWFLQEKGIQEILSEVNSAFAIDSSRVYLTGLSRGGAGTWGLASRMQDVFAAMVPLCGVINGIVDYDHLKDIPIWVAHNDQDDLVAYSESTTAVDKIEKLSGATFLRINTPSAYKYDYQQAKRIFTTFARDNHDAWSGIYDRQEVYIWLLNHRK